MPLAAAAAAATAPARRHPACLASFAGGLATARHFTTHDDSHDDFKPKVKAAPSAGVEGIIEQDIASHDVFIYMKVRRAAAGPAAPTPRRPQSCSTAGCQAPALRFGCRWATGHLGCTWYEPPGCPATLVCMQGVPQAPMCGFSNMACAILNLYGEAAAAAAVAMMPALRP